MRVHHKAAVALAAALLLAGPARADWPAEHDLVQAVDSLRPLARSWRLDLQWGTLWAQALAMRSPLVASYRGGACHLGFSGYTARGAASPLLAGLTPAQRGPWLRALLQHELLHCLVARERSLGRAPASVQLAAGSPGAQSQADEVLADLAAGLQLQADGVEADALLQRLHDIRQREAAQDPLHDSTAALRCLLASQARTAPVAAARWLDQVQDWARRCDGGPLRLAQAEPDGLEPKAPGLAHPVQAGVTAAR